MRRQFAVISIAVLAAIAIIALFYPPILWSLLLVGPIIAVGVHDYVQTSHAVLRNFPVIGHLRYLLEELRPEIQQYFIELETEGMPFSRDQRSVVYQRAKNVRDTIPFGTQKDVYEVGYEWINHSMQPLHLAERDLRVMVGGPDCTQPYSASLLNISAMSFGSLSANAVQALSQGAQLGGFAHNTGEGGISPYHLAGGGDLIWQIGTGYFGCRRPDGSFDPERFAQNAAQEQVKMIEVKLSQGAKPGHGGILPAAKLTPEIAAIRGVPLGADVLSPPGHSTFDTPLGLLAFVAELRRLAGGKPVGFKLCVGNRHEFLAVCKAMVESNITPDFITVDGGEGGTGAAPMEFANHVGSPLVEGLIFVHNALVGFDLRERVRIIAVGKVTTGFGMIKRLALGADLCYAARGMMLALGCIQAMRCNTNRCPVGVATQDAHLRQGLVVAEKYMRVANFHRQTIRGVLELLGAMGLEDPADLTPWHVVRRVSATEVKPYAQIYRFLPRGALLQPPYPPDFQPYMGLASAQAFAPRALPRA